MAKVKYRLNENSLQIEEVVVSKRERLLKVLMYTVIAAVFSTVTIFISDALTISPNERKLKQENEFLKFQYELVDSKMTQVEKVLVDIEKKDDNLYRSIFFADPISESERKAGYGGSDRYNQLKGYLSSEQVVDVKQRLDKLSRRIYIQSKSFDELYKLSANRKDMMQCIPAIMPMNIEDLNRIASGFGYRVHPVYRTVKMHTGVDLTAEKGTPVYATGNGKVGKDLRKQGYGKIVIINHGYNYKTYYAHLSKILVRAGQKVKRGELIGYVGTTGVSTGPHLHYEVRYKEVPVNPVHFFYNDLTPEEYEEVIEISSRPNMPLS